MNSFVQDKVAVVAGAGGMPCSAIANMKLVLLAGQSNRTGRGYAAAEDLTFLPGVRHFANERLHLA